MMRLTLMLKLAFQTPFLFLGEHENHLLPKYGKVEFLSYGSIKHIICIGSVYVEWTCSGIEMIVYERTMQCNRLSYIVFIGAIRHMS